ncbi:MAG: radical SAM protein [Candidatus Gygaella obscura]|nr:radical SAM protein [Candidatus Gygaella obscura]
MVNNVRQFSSDKILKHLDRVVDWFNGNNPYPVTVELDLTNVCNHKCPACTGWVKKQRDLSMLPVNLTKKIINQLAYVKIRGLIFTGGGEPLCYPHVREILNYAAKENFDIAFITNGSLLNKEIADQLLRVCTWVRVSLDAATPMVFRKTHGLDRKNFLTVTENIRLLAKRKKELKSNTAVGVGFLTCQYSKGQMYKATLLCKSLGVDYIQFRPMQIVSEGRLTYDLMNIDRQLVKCMEEETANFKVLYSKHKYEMMKEPKFGRYYKKCFGQQFATVISADAKMYVCCHMRGNNKYCIGDLHKSSFKKIWNSNKRKKVVESIDFKDCVPLCRDNTFNQVLWNIKEKREHVNFL